MVVPLDTLYVSCLFAPSRLAAKINSKLWEYFWIFDDVEGLGVILHGTLRSTNLFSTVNTEAIAYFIRKLSLRL